jgi:uncharacterized protein
VKIVIASVCTLFLATGSVLAQNAAPATTTEERPSDESIRRLLEVMQAQKLMETAVQQVDATYGSIVSKMLEGKPLSPEQQKTLEAGRERMKSMMHEILSWESMQALYLKVYGDTFSQSEIDSMIEFYSSPAGHAVIVKLPLAMQNTMAQMQERMRALIPKMQQMAKETADQIKSEGANANKDKSG